MCMTLQATSTLYAKTTIKMIKKIPASRDQEIAEIVSWAMDEQHRIQEGIMQRLHPMLESMGLTDSDVELRHDALNGWHFMVLNAEN